MAWSVTSDQDPACRDYTQSVTASPNSPMTTSGCIMDVGDSTAFLAWAEGEGHIDSGFELGDQMAAIDDDVSEYKSRVLSNAVIHGGLDLLLPREAHDVCLTELSRKLGLDVIVDYPIDLADVQVLDGVCQKLVCAARELEDRSDYTGLWSLNDVEGRTDATDSTTSELIDDYNYYLREFRLLLLLVDTFAPELFRKFISSQQAVVDSLESMSVDGGAMYESLWGGSTDESSAVRPWEIDSAFLLREMNLWPREGVQALAAREQERLQHSFLTAGLGDMFDAIVSWRQKGFSDSAELGMTLGMAGTPHAEQILGFWLAWLQFRQLFRISGQRSSAMCFAGSVEGTHEISTVEDGTQLFRVYVEEVNAVPKVDTFGDLIRLYHDPNVERFREQLSIWRTAVSQGEVAIVKRMRRDFELAMKDLSRATTLRRVGGLVSVVALPVAVGGLLTGLPLDFAFTAVGPAISARASGLAERAQWVHFGTAHNCGPVPSQ